MAGVLMKTRICKYWHSGTVLSCRFKTYRFLSIDVLDLYKHRHSNLLLSLATSIQKIYHTHRFVEYHPFFYFAMLRRTPEAGGGRAEKHYGEERLENVELIRLANWLKECRLCAWEYRWLSTESVMADKKNGEMEGDDAEFWMENVCIIPSGSIHDAEYLLGIHRLEYLQWIPVALKRNGTAVMCSDIMKLGAWKETAEFAK